jgi:lipopolysaccharide export system protein LptC
MADTNILHCNETDPTDLNFIIELKDIKASKAIQVPHLEYIMTNNEQVLLESQVARSSQLAQIDDRAEELLSKAKALHFKVWQGTNIATTEWDSLRKLINA